MTAAVCAVVRNESASILEWIAYHLAIGFDQVLLFDNRSTDSTAQLARQAGKSLPVQVIEWPDTSPRFQLTAYEHALEIYRHSFDWIAFLDGDEFLVPQRDFHVTSLLKRLDAHAAIALPWLVFGSSGRKFKAEGLLTSAFFRRAERNFSANKHVKSIVRPDVVVGMSNPHAFATRLPYVHADGCSVRWKEDGISFEVGAVEFAHVNHYFVKSQEDWGEKMVRGHQDGTTRSVRDFETYDRNEVFDGYAMQYSDKVKELISRVVDHDFASLLDEKNRGQRHLAAELPYKVSVEAFDAEAYLTANPDVANSSLSAVHHYFNIGIFENRRLVP